MRMRTDCIPVTPMQFLVLLFARIPAGLCLRDHQLSGPRCFEVNPSAHCMHLGGAASRKVRVEYKVLEPGNCPLSSSFQIFGFKFDVNSAPFFGFESTV